MKFALSQRSLTLGLLGAIALATAMPAMARPGVHHGGPARLLQQADGDGNGRVTEAEGLNFLSSRFAEADTDKDGGLTREEVSNFLRAQREANRQSADRQTTDRQNAERRDRPERAPRRMESRVDTMFRAADANRDGKVTLEELQPMAMAMFRAADRNNDGELEAAELRGPRHHRGPGAPQRGQGAAPAVPG